VNSNLPVLREFSSAVLIAYAITTAVGVGVTIETGTSFHTFLTIALASISVGLGIALYRATRGPKLGTNDIAKRAITAIVDTVPEGRFLTDFLSSPIFNGLLPADPKMLDTVHRIKLYRKDFKLVGSDIHTHEEYHGVNAGHDSSCGMKFVTFGGSTVDKREIVQKMWQETTSGQIALRPDWVNDGDRLKVFFTPFSSPIPPESEFKVGYEEFWPRAMLPGFDAVFYTQTLYFSNGVFELRSKLTFDSDVDYIAAYWCDLTNGICKPHNHQPVLIESPIAVDGPTYEWGCTTPGSDRLHFIAFRRRQYEAESLALSNDAANGSNSSHTPLDHLVTTPRSTNHADQPQ